MRGAREEYEEHARSVGVRGARGDRDYGERNVLPKPDLNPEPDVCLRLLSAVVLCACAVCLFLCLCLFLCSWKLH